MNLDQLEKTIGYSFRDKSLLAEALTHRSFNNESATEKRNNERLEFLGDAVLALRISENLMRMMPQANEGGLTKSRSSIVDEKTLAAIARDLNIGAFLRLSNGEERTGGRTRNSMLADAVEAIIAAIYQDGGVDDSNAFIDRFFSGMAARAAAGLSNKDHKTVLQELLQAARNPLPVYEVVEVSGADHSPVFIVEVKVDGVAAGRGCGRNKKEAEQAAARAACESMTAENMQATEG